ncbi:hypothetical protein M885DRAFT_616600, partial [Pelagophyceae sp. CCMP2097]
IGSSLCVGSPEGHGLAGWLRQRQRRRRRRGAGAGPQGRRRPPVGRRAAGLRREAAFLARRQERRGRRRCGADGEEAEDCAAPFAAQGGIVFRPAVCAAAAPAPEPKHGGRRGLDLDPKPNCKSHPTTEYAALRGARLTNRRGPNQPRPRT